MTDGDRLRAILGARDAGADRDGETLVEAAERVVAERDFAKRLLDGMSKAIAATNPEVGRFAKELEAEVAKVVGDGPVFDWSQWRR